MRVLDFDNTIYDGESPLDFYLFSLRYNPFVLRFAPRVIRQSYRYKRARVTLEEMEAVVAKCGQAYLDSFDDIEGMIERFWDTHMHKIKSWYIPQPDDVIMTASFDCMMDVIMERLGIQNCICSTVDMKTHVVTHLNFGNNKVAAFKESFGDEAVPDEFYTDNLSDLPMMRYARQAFLVKGNRLEAYRE